MNDFKYKGYMSDEAIAFFGDKMKMEEREGIAVIGFFITLSDGKTHMPYKGDIFIKDDNGEIILKN